MAVGLGSIHVHPDMIEDQGQFQCCSPEVGALIGSNSTAKVDISSAEDDTQAGWNQGRGTIDHRGSFAKALTLLGFILYHRSYPAPALVTFAFFAAASIAIAMPG